MARGNPRNILELNKRPRAERVASAKKAALASAKKRAEGKSFKESLKALLSLPAEGVKDAQGKAVSNGTAMALRLIKEALDGSTRAFEVVRDTVGERPTDKVSVQGELSITGLLEEVERRCHE